MKLKFVLILLVVLSDPYVKAYTQPEFELLKSKLCAESRHKSSCEIAQLYGCLRQLSDFERFDDKIMHVNDVERIGNRK